MANLRKLAKGRECQVRYPGVCNFNPETTVLAHIGGAGMGIKAHDIHGAWCCLACHDLYDSRNQRPNFVTRDEIKLGFLEGVIRTQEILIKEGVIK